MNNQNKVILEEIIDNDTLKKRFRFPGNLKLPVEAVNGMSEADKNKIIAKLQHLQEDLSEILKGESAGCFVYELSQDVSLYIDYKKGEINLYIEDERNGCFTQTIDSSTALDITNNKNQSIIEKLKEYLDEDISLKRENNLVSTLVHSAHESANSNRGSPTVFGKKLDSDFDLDL